MLCDFEIKPCKMNAISLCNVQLRGKLVIHGNNIIRESAAKPETLIQTIIDWAYKSDMKDIYQVSDTPWLDILITGKVQE